MQSLFVHYLEHPEELPADERPAAATELPQSVIDYVAGMTDRFAIRDFERLFVPKKWLRVGGRVGRISDDDIRRVRDATDLVGLVSERVVLKQKGRLFWGCCPFHAEKTPSFKVDPATQLWHCFGCGLGGDAFGYVMRTENVEFVDAVRMLAERAHIEIHEEDGRRAPRPEGPADRRV